MCVVKQNYIGRYYKALVIDRLIYTIDIYLSIYIYDIYIYYV